MRILVAIDGSPSATIAAEQARELARRSSSQLRLVAVVPPSIELQTGPWMAGALIPDDLAEQAAGRELQRRLDDELARLGGTGEVTSVLLHGSPADEIVAEAARWPADLVVVGSRGHGPLTTILLGSVSQAVADRSPVPVLVARRSGVGSIIVGVDGSPASMAGLEFLATHPPFDGIPTTVVGVVPPQYPWWVGASALEADAMPGAIEGYEAAVAEERRIANAGATLLRQAGVPAVCLDREGDPADQLVRESIATDADIIVIGSRGRTGLSRLVLGSVATSVLQHARCSVLVVHGAGGTHPALAGTRAEEPATHPQDHQQEPASADRR